MKIGSALFKKELALIKNTEVRNAVIEILDNDVHTDNFIKPSSSTGKYHPDFDNMEYGNTNHTKAVVKLCNVLLTSRIDLNEVYSDIVYASAILHDMWKYCGTKHTRNNHAELGYDFLKSFSKQNRFNSDVKTVLSAVAECVRYHMGHWSMENTTWIDSVNKLTKNLRDCILILHYADMIASRNFYNVKDFSL